MSGTSSRRSAKRKPAAPRGPRGILRRGPNGEPSKWWPAFFLGVALVVLAAWGVTKSPIFEARHIKVTGTSQVTPQRILALAGVGPGTNLFWFNSGTAEKRLESDPWIRRAVVQRSLPSTLRISIEERRPAAQITTGYRRTVLAGDGTILSTVRRDAGLPNVALSDALTPQATPGSTPRASVRVVGAMGKWLRSQVRSVVREDDGDILLHLRSGTPVYYGHPTAVMVKDQVLASLVRWMQTSGKELEWISVRTPVAPTAQLMPMQEGDTKQRRH